MAFMVLSANKSNVLIDGKTVAGLQEITYQTVKPHQDIPAIGTDERIAVVYGTTRVTGTMRIRSVNDEMEDLLVSKKAFSIFISLAHQLADGSDDTKEISLEDCYMTSKSWGLAHGNVVEIIYSFTATREK